MTKILEIEVNRCLDCPSHNAFLSAGECRCNKVDKVLDVPCQSSIPSWCPLPDKQEKGENDNERD